jgi:uncharacterized protein CbrC (UPF0167 family)
MVEALPSFRYHPDPVATGVVRAGDEVCRACGKKRGWVYVGPVYAKDQLDESICPWCIADGSAATKLGASFADAHPLAVAGIDQRIVDEVNLRTPGFTSWQSEQWLTHCNDACEFHGDASRADLATIPPDALEALVHRFRLSEVDWVRLVESYVPGGEPALYRFKCRHCNAVLFGMDFS